MLTKTSGGFSFLPGGRHPFSNGVIALPGHRLVRVRLPAGTVMAEGMAAMAGWMRAHGYSPLALAGCELRSQVVMSFVDFAAFNATYIETLRANGFSAEGSFPITRSNLVPNFDVPMTNELFGFTVAVPDAAAPGGEFVVAGKPEVRDAPFGIVAEGDVSEAGLREKTAFIMDDLRQKVADLGGVWREITGVQVYTIHALDEVMAVMAEQGLASVGLTVFPSAPPVLGCDVEVDVRSVREERWLL